MSINIPPIPRRSERRPATIPISLVLDAEKFKADNSAITTDISTDGLAGMLAVLAEFEREILRKRVRAGLAHARQNGKRLGRPRTAARKAGQVRALHRAGISKAEIARRLQIGRTSVRRILA